MHAYHEEVGLAVQINEGGVHHEEPIFMTTYSSTGSKHILNLKKMVGLIMRKKAGLIMRKKALFAFLK
jgi:hypothetical protein